MDYQKFMRKEITKHSCLKIKQLPFFEILKVSIFNTLIFLILPILHVKHHNFFAALNSLKQ